MLTTIDPADTITARRLIISGQVQGVGFRPFIYNIALEHELCGWVRNCIGMVEIHVQGSEQNLQRFTRDIFDRKPALAKPELQAEQQTSVTTLESFIIQESLVTGKDNRHISVPTDLFLCDDCLQELNDPCDRRYHYPFINCTQCGPRYTLIKKLPYDRQNTTMTDFDLCPDCLAEYNTPSDRRFHAEPVACPACGPSLYFHLGDTRVDDNERALAATVEALEQGKTIAVKGIGGYHLMCDASNTEAIEHLRNNKPRPDKPLAVMFPAPVNDPFQYAEVSVKLSESDRTFLLQPARAILLVEKLSRTSQQRNNPPDTLDPLSENIAPGLNEIGVMLPYSPLHHLLLDAIKRPLIATSANIVGEPVLIDNDDIEKRLHHVCHGFLHHNRPIQRPADDPVYRTIANTPRPIRTGRGSSPLEISLPFVLEKPVLAVGAHMKNTVTLAWKNRAVLSTHIGEMNSIRSMEVFETTVADLQKLYGVQAEIIVCDAHPGYTTSRWAKKQDIPVHKVFHHHAHASAAYYECRTDEPVTGKDDDRVIIFSWDGIGYGEDDTLWGGEAFVGRPGTWTRCASMRPFYLPGGDKAGRELWRSAAALCWETGQTYSAIPEKDQLLKQAWQKKINAVQSTSVGRLFDAAAALTDLRTTASFEGQGPMELEALCFNRSKTPHNNIVIPALEKINGIWTTDWAPLIPVLLDDKTIINERAIMFHQAMSHILLQQAIKLREEHDVNTVGFSGGVFQNRFLSEHAMALLNDNGFNVCFPQLIPVNDAGISFGQVMDYGFNNSE